MNISRNAEKETREVIRSGVVGCEWGIKTYICDFSRGGGCIAKEREGKNNKRITYVWPRKTRNDRKRSKRIKSTYLYRICKLHYSSLVDHLSAEIRRHQSPSTQGGIWKWNHSLAFGFISGKWGREEKNRWITLRMGWWCQNKKYFDGKGDAKTESSPPPLFSNHQAALYMTQ